MSIKPNSSIKIKVSDQENINIKTGFNVNINRLDSLISQEAETRKLADTQLQREIDAVNIKLDKKQDTLISGQSIKTLNGESLLGTGDIEISGADAYTKEQTDELLATKQAVLVSGENLRSVNGQSLLGAGNVTIKTYQSFESSWPTSNSSTTVDFCTAVNETSSAMAGMGYIGEVMWSDLPDGLTNTEVVVEIMQGTGTTDKVIHLVITSGNIAPYRWEYTYWANGLHVSGWITFQPELVSGTSIKTINGESLLGSGDIELQAESMIETTWSELKSLRDNSQLIPGAKYRMTDYTATTVQPETRSAEHQFDLILTALTESTLSEKCSACIHEGDTYFTREVQTILSASLKPGVTLEDTQSLFTMTIGGEDTYSTPSASDRSFTEISTFDRDGVIVPCLFDPSPDGDGNDCWYVYAGKFTLDGTTYDMWQEYDIPERSYNVYYELTKEIVDAEISTKIVDTQNVNKWQIWYCLDNDTQKFGWAQIESSTPEQIIVSKKTDEYDHVIPGGTFEFLKDIQDDEFGTLHVLTPMTQTWNSDEGDYVDCYYAIVSDIPDYGTEIHCLTTNFERDSNLADYSIDRSYVVDDFIPTSLTAEGKGVIYRMIDNNNNDLPYDFKNIQFKRYKLAIPDSTVSDLIKDPLIQMFGNKYFGCIGLNGDIVCPDYLDFDNTDFIWCYTFSNYSWPNSDISLDSFSVYDNKIEVINYNVTGSTTKQFLNNNVFYKGNIYCNIIGKNSTCNTIDYEFCNNNISTGAQCNICGEHVTDNDISSHFHNNVIESVFVQNNIGSNFYSNNIDSRFTQNITNNSFCNNNIGSDFLYNKVGRDFSTNIVKGSCSNNSIGYDTSENSFGIQFNSNIINDHFNNNSTGSHFEYNTIKNYFRNNSIADYFTNNTIENSFIRNIIQNQFQNNIIGNDCFQNTIESHFENNLIRDGFSSNIIAESFTNNDIGDSFANNTTYGRCVGNSFGYYCEHNYLGNFFANNTIGTMFSFNTTGVNFGSNHIGNVCGSNSIGRDFFYNSLGNDCHGNTIGNFFQHNYAQDGVCYTEWSAVDSGQSNVQYVSVLSGVRGSDLSNKKVLSMTRGLTTHTTFKPAGSTEVEV